jgi:hypothetical protein
MVGALILLPLRIETNLRDNLLWSFGSQPRAFDQQWKLFIFGVFFVLSNLLDYSILVSVASIQDFDWEFLAGLFSVFLLAG